jgi:hypothetical protein
LTFSQAFDWHFPKINTTNHINFSKSLSTEIPPPPSFDQSAIEEFLKLGEKIEHNFSPVVSPIPHPHSPNSPFRSNSPPPILDEHSCPELHDHKSSINQPKGFHLPSSPISLTLSKIETTPCTEQHLSRSEQSRSDDIIIISPTKSVSPATSPRSILSESLHEEEKRDLSLMDAINQSPQSSFHPITAPLVVDSVMRTPGKCLFSHLHVSSHNSLMFKEIKSSTSILATPTPETKYKRLKKKREHEIEGLLNDKQAPKSVKHQKKKTSFKTSSKLKKKSNPRREYREVFDAVGLITHFP